MADEVARVLSEIEKPTATTSDGPTVTLPQPPKKRMSADLANVLVAKELSRDPFASAEDLRIKLNCSNGLIKKTKSWQANQRRLVAARSKGANPKVLPLSNFVSLPTAEDEECQRDERLDRELNQKIGTYSQTHPDASVEQVARAIGCTARDVEVREAIIDDLIKEQAASRREDEGFDEDSRRGVHRKWVTKRL